MKNSISIIEDEREFSINVFNSFIKELSTNVAMFENSDWREIVRKAFALKELQEKSLKKLSKISSNELQSYFNQINKHIKLGNKVDGKIIKNSSGTHTVFIFLEKQNSFSTMIKIACCDANCENWHWGNHRSCR